MDETPKTGRDALNRRGLLWRGLWNQIKVHLEPLTPADKLEEIDFVIDELELQKRWIEGNIKDKKEAQQKQQKADKTLFESIGQQIKNPNYFSKFEEFLKKEEGKEGGYKKSIRTRKNIKKNNKSFRRK